MLRKKGWLVKLGTGPRRMCTAGVAGAGLGSGRRDIYPIRTWLPPPGLVSSTEPWYSCFGGSEREVTECLSRARVRT